MDEKVAIVIYCAIRIVIRNNEIKEYEKEDV